MRGSERRRRPERALKRTDPRLREPRTLLTTPFCCTPVTVSVCSLYSTPCVARGRLPSANDHSQRREGRRVIIHYEAHPLVP
jgi:hypothetical protein